MHTAPHRDTTVRGPGSRRAALASLALTAAALATAATAMAAHPQAGSRWSGFTASAPINGFKAPVTFTVSSSATTLSSFTYSSFGCVGAGGFRPGIDYYTKPEALIKVGKVKLSGSGRFSATSVFSHQAFGVLTKTTSKVSGLFTSPRTAKGTITFSQHLSGKYTTSCGPASIQFSVKRG